MISIYLYGKLRKYAKNPKPSGDSVVVMEAVEGENIEMLLRRAGINLEEIYTIFLNAKLLTTHNRMARWLEYPQAFENPHDWDLSIIVKDGDRVGLFGRDMPALVV